MLVALNRMMGTDLSTDQLCAMGVQFGADKDDVARLVTGIAARNDEHIQVITNLTNALDDPSLIEQLATTRDPQFVLDLLSGHRAA